MRFHLDADITPKLARLLRERGYDILSAHEVGNTELSDPEQMAFAASQGRALLTCNAQDFTSPAPLTTTGISGVGPTSRGFVAPGALNREVQRRIGRIERTGQDRGSAESDGGRGGEFRVIRVAPGFRVHGGGTTDGSGKCPLNSKSPSYWGAEKLPPIPSASSNLQLRRTILFAFNPRSW